MSRPRMYLLLTLYHHHRLVDLSRVAPLDSISPLSTLHVDLPRRIAAPRRIGATKTRRDPVGRLPNGRNAPASPEERYIGGLRTHPSLSRFPFRSSCSSLQSGVVVASKLVRW
jgi:hypothetical protein